MKPFKTLFYCFLLLFPFSSSLAVHFDWSGWTRLEAYYQHEDNYYGDFHFVLNPDIFITDNLSLKARMDLLPFFKGKGLMENFQLLESAYRQTGYVFLYKEKGKKQQSKFPLVFLFPSQFYVDYQEEFFKVRLGRAPYHFGMGVTHSAEENPFGQWISLYNQLSLHVEYSSFYFQPALLHSASLDSSLEGQFLFAFQAGLQQKNWQISALFQHAFKKDSFLELFGEYEQVGWDLKASSSYSFKSGEHFSLALEGKMKWHIQVPVQLALKAGGVSGDIVFHPNYNLALLFWNRWMEETESSQYPYQIADGQVQKALYLSPRAVFFFLDGALQVQPLLLLSAGLEDKELNYELDLETRYQWDENLFFSLTGGALYSRQKFHLSLLAQTAASF